MEKLVFYVLYPYDYNLFILYNGIAQCVTYCVDQTKRTD